jgi:hypothetical protein
MVFSAFEAESPRTIGSISSLPISWSKEETTTDAKDFLEACRRIDVITFSHNPEVEETL